MRYFIIERLPLWIYRFADENCVIEHVTMYAGGIDYPLENVILREDGVLCRVLPETFQKEYIEFVETSELIALDRVNDFISQLCARYNMANERVTTLTQLAPILDALCERKAQLQRRFNLLLYLVIIAFVAVPFCILLGCFWFRQ